MRAHFTQYFLRYFNNTMMPWYSEAAVVQILAFKNPAVLSIKFPDPAEVEKPICYHRYKAVCAKWSNMSNLLG